MDRSDLKGRAGRVSVVLNGLATAVLVLGAFFAIGVFMREQSMGTTALDGIIYGLTAVLGIAVFVAVAWASIQVSSLIAGYIETRLGGQAD